MKQTRYKKMLIQAVKIAVGSSASIYFAERMGLKYATSVGGITLLTIVATKWDTLRLSVYRILSFLLFALFAKILFQTIDKEWIAFGIYIFLVVMISGLLNWNAVISVNAVIGTHFMAEKELSYAFIENEFWLVMIGITVAIVLNLFHGNKSQRNRIMQNIVQVEKELQSILRELASYLDRKEMKQNVWVDIRSLEEELQYFIELAYEYKENTFYAHPQYYIDYFEMRAKQCSILHNLHYEIKKIRKIPQKEKIVSEYMLYLVDYVTELNVPNLQIHHLNTIIEKIKQESLPINGEEFESKAMLYHILMDLEDFLIIKKRFVESLDEKQKKIYWDKK